MHVALHDSLAGIFCSRPRRNLLPHARNGASLKTNAPVILLFPYISFRYSNTFPTVFYLSFSSLFYSRNRHLGLSLLQSSCYSGCYVGLALWCSNQAFGKSGLDLGKNADGFLLQQRLRACHYSVHFHFYQQNKWKFLLLIRFANKSVSVKPTLQTADWGSNVDCPEITDQEYEDCRFFNLSCYISVAES